MPTLQHHTANLARHAPPAVTQEDAGARRGVPGPPSRRPGGPSNWCCAVWIRYACRRFFRLLSLCVLRSPFLWSCLLHSFTLLVVLFSLFCAWMCLFFLFSLYIPPVLLSLWAVPHSYSCSSSSGSAPRSRKLHHSLGVTASQGHATLRAK